MRLGESGTLGGSHETKEAQGSPWGSQAKGSPAGEPEGEFNYHIEFVVDSTMSTYRKRGCEN